MALQLQLLEWWGQEPKQRRSLVSMEQFQAKQRTDLGKRQKRNVQLHENEDNEQ